MNVENYRIFIRVVETGNLTKTAQEMGYTQSGISRVLSKIDQELKVKIINRTTHGITILPGAEVYIDMMRAIIEAEDRLLQQTEKEGK